MTDLNNIKDTRIDNTPKLIYEVLKIEVRRASKFEGHVLGQFQI
jgi:hypothetical protein